MKKIYIILTQSGTFISKMLKFFSRKPFNHASLALDKSLYEFYSFGRKVPTNPFIGGFVIEHTNTGVFEIFGRSPAIVIELPVTDEQYEKIKNTLHTFIKNKDIYKYDFINLPLVYSKYHLNRRNRFFCSQFVAYVLNSANISTPKVPEHIQPIEFLQLENISVIYKGDIQDYNKKAISR